MKDWKPADFVKYFKISREKAQAWYDAWQCEDYTVRHG